MQSKGTWARCHNSPSGSVFRTPLKIRIGFETAEARLAQGSTIQVYSNKATVQVYSNSTNSGSYVHRMYSQDTTKDVISKADDISAEVDNLKKAKEALED